MKSDSALASAPVHATGDDTLHRVRVEQVRLLCGNLGSSVLPGILVALLVAYALRESAGLWPLLAWAAGVIASKLFDYADARRMLRMEITPANIDQIKRRLVVLHGIDGAAWGLLAPLALDTASPGGSILLIGVLAGGGRQFHVDPVTGAAGLRVLLPGGAGHVGGQRLAYA